MRPCLAGNCLGEAAQAALTAAAPIAARGVGGACDSCPPACVRVLVRACVCLCVRACACACVCVIDCVWLEGGMGGIACVCIACVRAHSVRPLRAPLPSGFYSVSAAEAERSIIGYTQCFMSGRCAVRARACLRFIDGRQLQRRRFRDTPFCRRLTSSTWSAHEAQSPLVSKRDDPPARSREHGCDHDAPFNSDSEPCGIPWAPAVERRSWTYMIVNQIHLQLGTRGTRRRSDRY